jgi:PEP-CTERM motif
MVACWAHSIDGDAKKGITNMRKLLLASVAVGAISFSGAAFAQFPNIGDDTAGPSLFFTFTNSGVTTTSNPAYTISPHPYDGSDDTYFGVINNSSKPITTIKLSSSLDIGGFDGDGINSAAFLNVPNNSKDTTGYGGPDAFFTSNTGDSLTVNFITPVAANGGTTFFALEEPVALNNIIPGGIPEPSTWGMMLLGFAGLGFAGYRKSKSRVALTT